jgi:hypothetical protein
MFTPSIQYQQSIQNIQAKVHENITDVKSKIANSAFIQQKDLEILGKAVEKINSGCEQILSLLSSHDVNKPDSFSSAEKLKLDVLNKTVMQNKEFFETILSKTSEKIKFL